MILKLWKLELYTIVYSALQISINTLKHVYRQMLYRASSNVIVSPFVEDPSCLTGEESISDRYLPVWKPGSLGSGSAVSLLNIKTTVDMVGLYSGHCCTHNRPTWIDRNTSFGLHDSFTELSISSNCLSSLYSLHAWEFRSLVNVSLGGKEIRLKPWKLAKYGQNHSSENLKQKITKQNQKGLYWLTSLTCPRRLRLWSGWQNPLFLLPLTISNTKTPKLYTSDFTEKSPSIAYSGGM